MVARSSYLIVGLIKLKRCSNDEAVVWTTFLFHRKKSNSQLIERLRKFPAWGWQMNVGRFSGKKRGAVGSCRTVEGWKKTGKSLVRFYEFHGSFCVCAQPMRDDVTFVNKILYWKFLENALIIGFSLSSIIAYQFSIIRDFYIYLYVYRNPSYYVLPFSHM